MSIVEKIGVPALLEQTAEECCELAQACLKMARKLRDENPTPKSIEDIRDNLVEEAVDVTICLDEIIATTDLIGDVEMFNVKASKLYRWEKRLDLHLDLDDEESRDSYYPYYAESYERVLKEVEEDNESV